MASTTAPSNIESNPHRNSRWLSRDFSDLVTQQAQQDTCYDVVIVGSGYGGAMAASQLAKGYIKDLARDPKICILERGREYLPGSFASQTQDLPRHVRIALSTSMGRSLPGDGLFDFRLGADVCALVASGLGGGSLINAAVMLAPDFLQFNSRLPKRVQTALTRAYLSKAKRLLGATRKPGNTVIDNTIALGKNLPPGGLAKTVLLKSLAAPMGATPSFKLAALTIAMQAAKNPFGVHLNACTHCGDCATGCNVGARESLDTNLLVQARAAGAEIYTGASVWKLRRALPAQGGSAEWIIEVVYTDDKLQERHGEPLNLRAKKVILAAGTFGSTEILLRSKEAGLPLSDCLGTRFSGNGDNLVALYKSTLPAQSVADETAKLEFPGRQVGPTITGMLHFPPTPLRRGFYVQEFSTPAPLKQFLEQGLATVDLIQRLPQWNCVGAGSPSDRDPLSADPQALLHSMVLGLIGHDQSDGRLSLEPPDIAPWASDFGVPKPYRTGQLRIEWRKARDDPEMEQAFQDVAAAAKTHLAVGGKLLPNPLTNLLPTDLAPLFETARGPAMTVHPLGGCPMGNNEIDGVVDEYGRVFKASAKRNFQANDIHGPFDQADKAPPKRHFQTMDAHDAWEGTLMVLDGSIIPGSLGANPALTIAALSLRAALHCLHAWGWASKRVVDTPQWVVQNPRPIARLPIECTSPSRQTTELQIVERLQGAIGNGLVAELTFGYTPITATALLSPPFALQTNLALRSTLPAANRLRIFEESVWHREHLNCADELAREHHAVVAAQLEGSLQVSCLQPDGLLRKTTRGFLAYVANRGLRDAWRHVREMQKDNPVQILGNFWQAIRLALRLASHAGEVRTLEYRMVVSAIDKAATGWGGKVQPGDPIHGIKPFTYAWRSNPWNQLLYLTLQKMPLADLPWLGQGPRLKLDARFLANRAIALARITQQQNQVTALADLAALAMLGLRMMLNNHLWSFRRPDAPSNDMPNRLPGQVKGLPPPQIYTLAIQHAAVYYTQPLFVRLTRYANPQSSHPPLVLIHGFSASGTTYAHTTLSPGMAQYFWERGFDVWLLDLRTSPDLPSARYSWSFEDVAWADIPIAIDHVATTTQAERQATEPVAVDVFAHCVGGLMLSMALLTDVNSQGFAEYSHSVHQSTAFESEHKLIYQEQVKNLPTRIRRVVLSQKSFALDYSDANVLRAYLMRYLRQWLPGNRYAFRPATPTNRRDKYIDMLLAALPYPDHEFDRENPPFWKFWQRKSWTTARHRMDALYEHTFNPNNLSDAVLDAIDDFFGPININTISQILHIARHKVITTTEGKNIFVSAKTLHARWPRGGTLGLHNSGNKMVDSVTLKMTQEWMTGAGIAYVPLALSGLAHQDGLIGVDRSKTFDAVLAFLSQDTVPLQAAPVQVSMALQPPWLGPRIKRFPDGSFQILVGANPGVAQAEIVVLPVARQNDTLTLAGILPPGLLPSLPLVATHSFVAASTAVAAAPAVFGPPAALIDVTPLIEKMLALQGLQPPAAVDGVVVLAYTHRVIPMDINGFDIARLFDALSHVEKAFCFVPIAAYSPAPANFPANGVVFSVGSCKYPAGVFDAVPAAASFRTMLELQQTARLQELLLLGDQIYADASAGLLDPSREDDRYQRPYEDLFRISALRDLMRTLPVHMMLDDHEVVNNWAPGGSLQDSLWFQQGINAYWRYQRAERRTAHIDLATKVCGFPLYMADTRTERAAPSANTPHARIMSNRQSSAIQAWLLALHADRRTHGQPKFISCASMILPRPIGMSTRTCDRLHFDSWTGYPTSRDDLLGFIAAHRIRGVVILSGDEHVGNATEVSISDGVDHCLSRVLSIHAPALYAPFPFANAAPTDFAAQDAFAINYLGSAYQCVVKARFAPQKNGFITLEVAPTLNGWQLSLTFHCEGTSSLQALFIV